MRTPRLYADTSVFGGVFDEEFAGPSQRLTEDILAGRFDLVTSAIVASEIAGAPSRVRELFDELSRAANVVEVSHEAVSLQTAYLDAAAVGERWHEDALHVALATVSDCDLLVSWNFRHIVSYGRIKVYNGVNTLMGYRSIAIHSPKEVVSDA
ncbi:MAG: PIN domain-containing protein [Armatimonadia bacterium]|nr:PIN domain-containing protein [Armatimonadia bacterium]